METRRQEEKYCSYFCNRECEYFPCHQTEDRNNFNCLFCYCPLYVLGDRCGGNFVYLPNGYKDCSNCLFPHLRENYNEIMARYGEIQAVMTHQDWKNGGEDQMEPFFPDLLNRFTDSLFIEKVCQKYHFEKSQMAELYTVAEEMLPLIRQEAGWERREMYRQTGRPLKKPCQTPEDAADVRYEEIVMTLGRGLDDLQESYTKKGKLSESYMLETLADELLLEGYGAYNRYIREHTAFHVARYYFYGSEEDFPLKMLPQVLKNFTAQVSCNEAYCMIPKKSVVFVAELTQDERIQCRGICSGCNSMQCPNRMWNDFHDKKLKISEAGL